MTRPGNPLDSLMGYDDDGFYIPRDPRFPNDIEDQGDESVVNEVKDAPDFKCPYGYGKYYESGEVYVPPEEYVPGQVVVPPTPSQISYENNEGWNTWARSVSPIQPGKFYDFNCGDGIRGCCIGVGGLISLGILPGSFTHSLMVDQSGVSVHENGYLVAYLKNNQMSDTNIRVFFQIDKSIVYCVTTGSEVRNYTSANKCLVPIPYIHGYLYSSNDTILTSSYIDGKVHYGSL